MAENELKALAYKDKIVVGDITAPGQRTQDTFLSGDGTFRTISAGDMKESIYDPRGIKADIFSLGNMTETEDAKTFSGTLKTKLSGIEEKATKNKKDADLVDRKNHTGVQSIDSVEDLQITLDGKFSKTNKPGVEDVTGLSEALAALDTAFSEATADTVKLSKKLTEAKSKTFLENVGALKHPKGTSDNLILADGSVAKITKELVGLGNVENILAKDLPVSDQVSRLLARKISEEGGQFKGQIFSDNLPDPTWLRKGTFFARTLPTSFEQGFVASSAFRSFSTHLERSFAPGVGFDYVQVEGTSKVEGTYLIGTVRTRDGVSGLNAGELQIQHQDLAGRQWTNWSFSGATGDFKSRGAVEAPFFAVKIDHPVDPSNKDLSLAVSISNEALITFTGTATLSKGTVLVDVEKELGLAKGTLKLLWSEPKVTSLIAVDSFDSVKAPRVDGTSFRITSENAKSTDVVNWVVTAKRGDAFVKWNGFNRADAEGKFIVEEEKV